MNSKDRPVLTVESLLAMRSEPDAIRVITERLGVKDMGPADHIRTKHEVKAFVESGDETAAKTLLNRSTKRLSEQNSLRISASQRSSIRNGP
jgi:hypothetical protein